MAEMPRQNALLGLASLGRREIPTNQLLSDIQRQRVGAQSLGPSMTNQTGAFDPLVGWWNGQPVTQSQAAALPVDPLSGQLNPSGRMVAESAMGATMAPTSIGGEIASKLRYLYNPPDKTPRAFADDYRNGAVTDEAGRIKFGIDGHPLTAPFIAGRSSAGVGGGVDEAIPAAQFNALAEAITGRQPEAVASRLLRGDAGQMKKYPLPDGSGTGYQIYVDKTLKPGAVPRIIAHEISHAIDEIAGQIPVDGLTREISPIYNLLATGQDRAKKLTLPQHLGYGGENIPRELMAEAIRAYMTNPNYLKEVAPRTATRIREYVNANPRLKSVIQFNSAAGAIGLGLASDGSEGE